MHKIGDGSAWAFLSIWSWARLCTTSDSRFLTNNSPDLQDLSTTCAMGGTWKPVPQARVRRKKLLDRVKSNFFSEMLGKVPHTFEITGYQAASAATSLLDTYIHIFWCSQCNAMWARSLLSTVLFLEMYQIALITSSDNQKSVQKTATAWQEQAVLDSINALWEKRAIHGRWPSPRNEHCSVLTV